MLDNNASGVQYTFAAMDVFYVVRDVELSGACGKRFEQSGESIANFYERPRTSSAPKCSMTRLKTRNEQAFAGNARRTEGANPL